MRVPELTSRSPPSVSALVVSVTVLVLPIVRWPKGTEAAKVLVPFMVRVKFVGFDTVFETSTLPVAVMVLLAGLVRVPVLVKSPEESEPELAIVAELTRLPTVKVVATGIVRMPPVTVNSPSRVKLLERVAEVAVLPT